MTQKKESPSDAATSNGLISTTLDENKYRHYGRLSSEFVEKDPRFIAVWPIDGPRGLRAPRPPECERLADLGDGFELWLRLPAGVQWWNLRLFSATPRAKRSWWLAWNGERLAHSNYSVDLRQRHPDVHDSAVEALRIAWLLS